MKITKGYPPNFDIIRSAFPKSISPNVIFTYGGTIYSPNSKKIPEHLIQHELVHSRRQGDDPDSWWKSYIEDIDFRFQEELKAHEAEYESCLKYGRNVRKRQLKIAAMHLSGSLYGNMVTKKKAEELILAGASRIHQEKLDNVSK